MDDECILSADLVRELASDLTLIGVGAIAIIGSIVVTRAVATKYNIFLYVSLALFSTSPLAGLVSQLIYAFLARGPGSCLPGMFEYVMAASVVIQFNLLIFAGVFFAVFIGLNISNAKRSRPPSQ